MLSQILDSILEGIGRCRKKYFVLQITEYAVYCLMYAMISSTNRCLHCLHIKTNKSSFFVVYITVYRNIFVFVKLKVFCGLFLEIKASNNVALQFFYLTFSREKKSERVTFLQLSQGVKMDSSKNRQTYVRSPIQKIQIVHLTMKYILDL